MAATFTESDLLKLLYGHMSGGQPDNSGINPTLPSWMDPYRTTTLANVESGEWGGTTQQEVPAYTFDNVFSNNYGSAPIDPTTGQPLWIPDEKKSIGERLGTAAAVLGGGAILGNYIAPMLSSWASGAGLSVGGTEAVAGSLGMDTAGLDALIAQQEAAAAASSGAGFVGEGAVSGVGAWDGAIGSGVPHSMGGPLSVEGIFNGDIPPTVENSLGFGTGALGPEGAATVGPGGVSAAPLLGGAPAGGGPGFNTPVLGGGNTNIPAPGTQNGQQRSVLDRLLSGELTPDMLGNLISGITGAVQQRNFGQDLLDRAAAATPNREYYEGALRQTYDNPMSYLQGPEYQAAQAITHNKLQRSDAAGGRLANDFGRQVQLQNHALQNLGNYRTGLANMVSQNQQTYSGQNGMFQQGAAADNNWGNSLLWNLLGN